MLDGTRRFALLRGGLAALPAVALLASIGSTATGQPAAPAPFPALPISVTTALEGGEPVVDDAWIAGQVENANTIFSPHGVTFRVVERHTMPEAHARLENRRDRHALGHLQHPQRIDVFLVRSLRDVDEPERMRQGVHWRPRGDAFDARAHLVIVSSIAGPTVLAHELGHYFGNGHSDVPGNIMSYERGDVPPFFDATQVARIRFSLRRFLQREELVAADAVATP
ncbi:MAG: hypothetical protein H6719_02255 [Sandaracinaceae bacterium]|nr:hypothetical protein [Sandaracinaceae bacterium]